MVDKMVSAEAQTRFFQFFDGTVEPTKFEKWVFEHPELEGWLGSEVYLELISFNYLTDEPQKAIKQIVENYLNMDQYYIPKVIPLLEVLVGTSWKSKNQLPAFLKLMEDLESMYLGNTERLQEILDEVVDLEGWSAGCASRIDSINQQEDKLLLAAYERTVSASRLALKKFCNTKKD